MTVSKTKKFSLLVCLKLFWTPKQKMTAKGKGKGKGKRAPPPPMCLPETTEGEPAPAPPPPPGAKTVDVSVKQLRGYLAKQAELKAKGIDEVIVYSCEFSAWMDDWGKKQRVGGSMITLMTDPMCALAEAPKVK